MDNGQDSSLFGLPLLHPRVLLLQEVLGLPGVGESCRAGHKAQPLSLPSNELARRLYTWFSATKIRGYCADMALDLACKQTKFIRSRWGIA